MKLTKITALLLAGLTSVSLTAASKSNNERWFEVEVILFNQLGDKGLLKEQFPEQENLPAFPKYRKVIDLLAPYLQPNISALKQQLPNCETHQYTENLIKQSAKLPLLFQEKSLQQIETIEDIKQGIEQGIENADNALAENDLNENSSANNNVNSESLNAFSNIEPDNIEPDNIGTNNVEIGNVDVGHIDADNIDADYRPTITAQEQALVLAAEVAFPELKFSDYQALPKQSKNSLCQIPEEAFEQYKAEKPSFDYFGIPVQTMPKVINNVEDVYSNKPYLISKDSLQLNDIVKQLKRSKGFQPLLHFGWRLAPKGRNQAEAYRVYAGDNLKYHFKKQEEAYQQATESLQSEQYNESIAKNTDLLPDSSQLLQQALSDKISEMVKQVNNIDVNDLTQTQVMLDTPNRTFSELTNETPLSALSKPEPASQPWFLDGLFRVHLNHYLYITADFNVMDMSLAQQATKALNSSEPVNSKPIRFQQNRRVISGEIHYFDHPYIGMLVQIRKHKRPEKEQEFE